MQLRRRPRQGHPLIRPATRRRTEGRKDRSVGPNISFAIPARVLAASAFIGVSAAPTFLQTVSRASFRAEVGPLLGKDSNTYRTLNWKAYGYTAAQGAALLGDASSAAPDDAEVEATLRSSMGYGPSGSYNHPVCVWASAAEVVRDLHYARTPVLPGRLDKAAETQTGAWPAACSTSVR